MLVCAIPHRIVQPGETRIPKKTSPVPEPADIHPSFVPVAEAFADDPRVSSGTMMAAFGLKVNGKIFAMSVQGRLVVKLPKARVDALVSGGRGERFDPGHGRLMKEWVVVEPAVPGWVDLAREAYRYVEAVNSPAQEG